MTMPIAETPLHEIYRRRAAKLEQRAGCLAPAAFGSVETEMAAARTGLAIGERTDAGTLELEGADLQDLADRLNVGTVAVGTAVLFPIASVAEVRWCRLTRHRARVLVTTAADVGRPALPEAEPSGYKKATPADDAAGHTFASPLQRGLFPVDTAFRPWLAPLAEALAANAGPCLHLADVTSSLTTLQLLGPRSPELLARVARLDLDPRDFRDRTLALTGAVGIPLQLLRWDWGPILGYELTVGRDVAAYFWDALAHSGDDLGLTPIGAEALSRLRPDESDPLPEPER